MTSKKKFFLIALKKVLLKIKEQGLRSTVSLIIKKLSPVVEPLEIVVPENNAPILDVIQINLPESYSIIIEGLKRKKIDKTSDTHSSEIITLDAHKLSFTWLVPFFSKGSGGHKNLFRFVKGLESLGCKCTVYIIKEFELGLNPGEIKEKIREYFEDIEAEVKIYNPRSVYEKADVLVCTSWITAYAGLTFTANLKVYFVQDYEPLFFSAGSYWHLAENTYLFGYYHLTLGPWLTHFLSKKYSVEADYYNIVVNKDLYYPKIIIKNEKIKSICNNHNFKICFYGRSVTPRRCFELVVMALYLLAETVTDITIIAYGWNDVPALPFKCYNLGTLDTEDLAELYSVCDICVAPSATNLSLVAREVMACGCVLMDLEAENTAYDLVHLSNSYLVKPDPKSIFQGLFHLYNDRQLLANLKQSSLDHVAQLQNWEYQVNMFYKLIKNKIQVMKDKMQTVNTEIVNSKPANLNTVDVLNMVKSYSLRQYLSEKYIQGEGIEVGALHRPLYISPAAKVKYVDRSHVADLKAHYPEFSACNFVEVDILDDGETLLKIEDESQEFVIANHFIEHCEDPIRTIQNHLRVLKPGGILYMAVPDKRLTFDIDRPITTTEHLINDYTNGCEISRKAHFQEWVNIVVKAPDIEANQKVLELMEMKYSIHFHVFTPESFLNFIFSVKEHIGIPFEIIHFTKNEEEIEFICIFQKQ